MLKPKKVFSVSMVKNEMDIIESFVRHNTDIFDGMIILDNGSTDSTVKILQLLKNEGLPLFIFENNEYQLAKMNQLLLNEINEFKEDILIPLNLTNFKKVFNLESEGKEIKENMSNINFCKDVAINYVNDVNIVVNLLESYEWLSLAYLDLKEKNMTEENRLKGKIVDLSMEIYEFYNEKINEKNKLNELMSSNSWKLTEPLRKFGKWVKNL